MSSKPPPGSLRPLQRPLDPALANVSAEQLARELIARLGRGDQLDAKQGGLLAMLLEPSALDDADRFGAAALLARFHAFHHFDGFRDAPIEGATVVDLGCGADNPLAMAMVYILLGARRALGVELEPVRDLGLAVRGVARAAGYMLLDPRLVVGEYPVTRAQVAQRVEGFDLFEMVRGHGMGVDLDRLQVRQESAQQLSLGDGEADLVVSNSFLEHVEAIDDVFAELARVTKVGGLSCHKIDGADHRIYRDATHSPLEFLAEAEGDGLVRGCNRVRPLLFPELFERHGFEVLHRSAWNTTPITAELRGRLVEPYRSMTDEMLGTLQLRLIARRR